MKKYLLFFCSFILGIIVGVGFFDYFLSTSNEVGALMYVAKLENIASKIYQTGNLEASILVLNFLVDELNLCQENIGKDNNYNTDKGFAHSRLFLLYKKKGEEDLAQQEYRKAIELLGKKYNILSQRELIGIIQKLDSATLEQKGD